MTDVERVREVLKTMPNVVVIAEREYQDLINERSALRVQIELLKQLTRSQDARILMLMNEGDGQDA